MAQKKKLQVFVSSTYVDLVAERQAAVEAILTAGHIPAGMELFAAGDSTQMVVIRRWIDESDVFLLILGGRYGSLDAETGKSYTHLEYEYAVERGKPLFAVVIDEEHRKDRVRSLGIEAVETDHPDKLKTFRAYVLTKMVRFWRDPRDIKLAILETMAEFSRRPDLAGWIPGSESANAGILAEEIARITKENTQLREQIATLQASSHDFNGLSFEEFYRLLASARTHINELRPEQIETLKEVAVIFGDPEPGLFHAFWQLSEAIKRRRVLNRQPANINILYELEGFGLVEYDAASSSQPDSEDGVVYKLTDLGRRFLLRLRIERDTSTAEKYFLN
jgi:hypothetical protein